MELRHLRCFVVLAEELHFARAAVRLNIEQSPLSRTIKELEYRLGVQLFNRGPQGTILTLAGEAFLRDIRRVFLALDHAKESARAAAAGQAALLRIAVSDGITQPRIASLLARCREEDPLVTVKLFEVPLAEQVRGLRRDLFDAGFSRTAEVGEGIEAQPLWSEPLLVAIPARHPLLAHARVPLAELVRHPLIICDPQVCEGYSREIEHILSSAASEINIAERVISVSMMLTLVSAGYGIGFATATQVSANPAPGVIARPLDADDIALTTFLLRKAEQFISTPLESFVRRALNELGEIEIDESS